MLLTGSYRTYEEWKQQLFVKYNYDKGRFLPYLWGMETYRQSYFLTP